MTTKKAAKSGSKAASKSPAKKAPARKAAAKKGPAKSSAKKTAAKSSASKGSSDGGRKYSRKASESVEREMHEMHEGKLTSGRNGKKVTNPKQAIAIGLSEARRAGKKVPPNPNQ